MKLSTLNYALNSQAWKICSMLLKFFAESICYFNCNIQHPKEENY